MANITSPITVNNVEKIYPDQLKPQNPKSPKDFADKSLEQCTQDFTEGTERYATAGGDPSKDSCSYWGLKPNQKVKSKPIPGAKNQERKYTVYE